MLGQEGVDYRAEGFNVTTRNQNNDYLTNVTSGTRASAGKTTALSHSSFLSSPVPNITTTTVTT